MLSLGYKHTVSAITKYKSQIWKAISSNLKTEGITIMNNAFEATNRYEHSGAHIYAYRFHKFESDTKVFNKYGGVQKAWTANLSEVDPVLLDKHNPCNYDKFYVYVTDNIRLAADFSTELVLRKEVVSSQNYVLAIDTENNKIAFHKISELKHVAVEKNQKGQDLVILTGLKFQKYYGKPSNKEAFENFKPDFLGNWHSNDKQYRGKYRVRICDEENNLLKEFRATSWRQFEAMTNGSLKANTLQTAWKNGRELIVLKKKGQVRNIWIGEDDMESLAAQIERYQKETQKNKVIVKKDNKYTTVKGYLKTTGWTTLTDRRTAEENLNVDNPQDTQICVNKPMNGKRACRKNEEVHKQNFLFECDNLSLEKQVDLINGLSDDFKKAILWACYSGGKSIHIVVKTNMPDDATRAERKHIHETLNSLYFNLKADPSGQNAARLARNPNATRENGRVQKAFLINDDKAIAYDVSGELHHFREQQRKLAERLAKLRENRSSGYRGEHTLEALIHWNQYKPSAAKQECIDFLKGDGKDWNRSAAVVRKLYNWGWSVDEIYSECWIPNDRWIKSALRLLEK